MISNSFLDDIKLIIRRLIPKETRIICWSTIPKLHIVNTYLLQKVEPISNLSPIDEKFSIRLISWSDELALQKAYQYQSKKAFKRKVPARLNSPEWVGIAVFDKTTGDIAYISWIITKTIKYFEEFGIILTNGQCLLKDGFCVPNYRHQGLHTRMEQERINYCVNRNTKEIYIQILASNWKGIDSVLSNEYIFYKQNTIIQWTFFNVYREIWSFIKNPFRRMIK